MKYRIKSDKPVLLEVTFYTRSKAVLAINIYEKGKSNTVYADRKYGSIEKPVEGKVTLKFPFPNRFTRLGIRVQNELKPTEKVSVHKIQHKLLPVTAPKVKEVTNDFIKFALEFAEKSGELKPGKYASDCDKFTISLLDEIRDYTTGKLIDTPARINHQTGLIEIAKKDFDKKTVTNRFYILMHEYAHFANNTTDEVECDLLAAKTCMEMGFSAIECLYSVSKLFMYNQNTDAGLKTEQEKRVMMVKDFIKKYAVI